MADDDPKSTSETARETLADDGSGLGETTTSSTGVVGSVVTPDESSVLNDPGAPRVPGTSARRGDVE